MDSYSAIISFFQNGGPFMYPIGIVLFFGMAIVVERWVFLTAARSSNRRAFNKMLPMIKSRNYKGLIDYAEKHKAPIAKIIAAGVVRSTQSDRRDEIEYAMEEGVMEALPRLEKRTPYLATLANIATLLGLLGTIIGLIAAFTAVANADPAEKATLLSNSISLAMNTTAFGLIAAIPLLMFHSIIQSKTTEIVDSLEMAAVKCLNIMGDQIRIQSKTRGSDANPTKAPVKKVS